MYVVNLEMDNSLKWFLFNIVSGQMANDSFSKWVEVFLLRIWLCFFFIPKGARKYPQTNSYNFAMTLISQHDHLTAGAWAACGLTNWITSLLQKYVKNHKIERTSWQKCFWGATFSDTQDIRQTYQGSTFKYTIYVIPDRVGRANKPKHCANGHTFCTLFLFTLRSEHAYLQKFTNLDTNYAVLLKNFCMSLFLVFPWTQAFHCRQ